MTHSEVAQWAQTLWAHTAPDAPPTQPLAGSLVADVAVIGAGYTGLSTALHLARGGAQAVVLEAREIGFGGSGRNAGLVNAGLWIRPSQVIRALGEDYGRRLLSVLGEAPKLVFDLVDEHGIRCDPVRTGTLHCAPNRRGEANLRRRHAEWQQLGAPVALLDAQETFNRTGTSAFCAALLDSRAGTIQPLAYARGLAQAAISAGASVFTRSAVRRCEKAGPGWIVETEHGRVRADRVVIATGAYTFGLRNEIREQQIHLPYFNFATRPLPETLRRTVLPGAHGVWDTRTILRSFRMDREGRLMVGSVGSLSGRHERRHREWALRTVRKVFPQLDDVDLEFAWDGAIDMTSDGLPRLHEIEPGLLCITGYNGRGIAPGAVFGRELARFILGIAPASDLPLPIVGLQRARFGPLLERFYRLGSAAAHRFD